MIMIERFGTSEDDFRTVFALLLEEHAEVAHAPLNAKKAAEHCYRVLQQGMTWVARDESGTAVGTLALKEVECWYSDQCDLFDGWFYVRPSHRNGRVGVALIQAAKAEAIARGQFAFIRVANANRRAKKTQTTLMAEMIGFKPCGYDLKLN